MPAVHRAYERTERAKGLPRRADSSPLWDISARDRDARADARIGGSRRRLVPAIRVSMVEARQRGRGRRAHGNLCPGARCLAWSLVLAARDAALIRARS